MTIEEILNNINQKYSEPDKDKKIAMNELLFIKIIFNINVFYLLETTNYNNEIFTIENTINIFITKLDADCFIKNQLHDNNKVITKEIKQSLLIKKIIELNTKTNQNIKLYIKKPINITFSLKRAIKLLELKQSQKDKQVYTTQNNEINQKEYAISEARKILDTLSKNERVRIKNNFSSLYKFSPFIQELIKSSHIPHKKIENDLSLQEDWINLYVKNNPSQTFNKDTIITLLKYFNLEKYLYQFKSSSLDLTSELNNRNDLDNYYFEQSDYYDNTYLLNNIKRTQDVFGYYIYIAIFTKNNHETLLCKFSFPTNLIIGKKYRLLPINEENREQKTKINESIKKQFKKKTNDEIITIKNNKIIAYLKSKYGWNLKKCKDITDELIQYPDILNELYEYTIEKKFPGKIKKIQNISIIDLNKKYKMSEIEAILLYLELKQNSKLAKSKIDELNLKLLNAKNNNY